MMYRKIMGLLLVVCVAITFLGVASAAEVVVWGEKFNVPDDFNKNEDVSYSSKGLTSSEESAFYENETDFINIYICSSNGIQLTTSQSPEYEDKTIAGIEGKYCEDNATGKFFEYIHDDKLISVQISNNSTLTFEDILITPSSDDSGSSFNLFG